MDAENPGAFSGRGWHQEGQSARLVSMNPSTGMPLAAVAPCRLEDYETVIVRSMAAAEQWRRVPAPKRGELIRCLGLILREHQDRLGTLIAQEMGKSKPEADGEVQEMIDFADFAVGQSRMLYGATMPSERPQHRMAEQWHPYGVVAVITAFNFPMAVWAWNAFLAAIAGNVTLWKPSTKVPLCAIAVHRLCQQVLHQLGYPDVFALIIPEDHAVTERLLHDQRIPVVSFTGSTAVGKQVASKVVSRLGKTILELGGNNAIILDEGANWDLAIPSIVFGAVGTAGQRCTSTRRLFVPEADLEGILKRLQQAYAQVTVGDPLAGHVMGPLIDAAAVQAFQDTLKEVIALGGKVVYGGSVLPPPGHFVTPTIVSEVQPQWEMVQTETFVPILYVMTYQNFDAAIAMHNAVPQGLSSALFTENLAHAEWFLSAWGSDCGIANINIGTSGAEIGGAFGGEKDTGGGREAGSDAWKAYMRRQTNTINWGKQLPLAQGIRFNSA